MAQVCPGCTTVTNQLVAAIKYQVQVVHIINIYTGCLLVRILHRCLSGPRSTVATLGTEMPVHSAPPLHPTLAGDHFSRSQAELQLAHNIEYLQQLYLAASESARQHLYEVMQFLKSKVRQISREPGTSSTNFREPGDLFTIGTGIMTRAGVLLVIIGVLGGGGDSMTLCWFSE